MSEVADKNLLKFSQMSRDELIDDLQQTNDKLVEKAMENEKCQQEIYELKQKLKAAMATHKDLADSNESLEESLSRQKTEWEKKLNNIGEKLAEQKKMYQGEILELQNTLTEAEIKNEHLREAIAAERQSLASLKKSEPDRSQETCILKEKINDLMDDLAEKDKTEKELLARQLELEETVARLQRDYDQTREILQEKKEDLRSVKDTLESTRDELVLCRSELGALKAVPASDTARGNSLFAEVEDNRQKMINDMNSLMKKYLHMKQTYSAKENEIQVLKVEKATLLRKWEGDNVAAIDQSARLIEMYKSRINELETKLKTEQKKQKSTEKSDLQAAGGNYSYLQNLLTAKKNEIEDLCSKLEESSVQKILLEERKFGVEKQLRHWEYKALSYQAQLLAAQGNPKCEECAKNNIQASADVDSTLSITVEQPDMELTCCKNSDLLETDRLQTFMDRLTQIPQIPNTEKEDRAINCSMVGLGKPGRTIPPKESGDSNPATSSEANGNALRSALAKPDEKSLLLKDQEKIKKNLRFTSDTVDGHEKKKLVRQKVEKKPYPVVTID